MIDPDLIKEFFPKTNWNRVNEIHRALWYELLYGPMSADYWVDVEPLEFYTWQGWAQAVDDLKEAIDELSHEMYYEPETGCITQYDPEHDDANWDEEGNWIGWEYMAFHPHEVLFRKEILEHIW